MTTNCRNFELQLTGLADPAVPTPELRGHLAACMPCRRYLAGLRRLDAIIPTIAVPGTSPQMKENFLAALPDLPTIIERRQVPVRSGSDSYAALGRRLAETRSWLGAGTAAALVLGIGLYFGTSGSRPQAQVSTYRHELLSKEVATLATLTKAATPKEKIAVWTIFLNDLHAEAKLLARGGEAREMDALARMYKKAATDGLAKQASLLPHHWTPAQRREALAAADAELAAAESDATAQAEVVPNQAKATFQAIAGGAKDARARLQLAIKGEAF